MYCVDCNNAETGVSCDGRYIGGDVCFCVEGPGRKVDVVSGGRYFYITENLCEKVYGTANCKFVPKRKIKSFLEWLGF